jgi:hypothetical protein
LGVDGGVRKYEQERKSHQHENYNPSQGAAMKRGVEQIRLLCGYPATLHPAIVCSFGLFLFSYLELAPRKEMWGIRRDLNGYFIHSSNK